MKKRRVRGLQSLSATWKEELQRWTRAGRFVYVLCFGLTVVSVPGTAARAQAQTADAPRLETLGLEGSLLRLELTDSALLARREGALVWQRSLYGIDAVASGPIQVGDGVYYAVGDHLYLLDASTGQVRGRQPLPGQVRKLSLKGELGELTLTGGAGASAWSLTCSLKPSGNDCPLWLPLERKGFTQARQEAANLITQAIQEGNPELKPKQKMSLTYLREPAVTARLASILPALEAAELQDVWNPWFIMQQAEILTVLEQPQRASQVLNRLFAGQAGAATPLKSEPGAMDALRAKNMQVFALELLGMSGRLDALDPVLADRAFQAGMAALLRLGYEPELTLGVLPSIFILGTSRQVETLAGRAENAPPDWAALTRRAHRIWDISPLAEGAAGLYKALANRAHEQGDLEGERLWLERTRLAAPTLYMGGGSFRKGSFAFELLQAGLWALLLCFGIRWLIHAGRGPDRWVRLRRWSRAELVGLLLLQVVLVGSALTTTRAMIEIGGFAQAPLSVGYGLPGHPEPLAFWAAGPKAPANSFMHALTLQQAGKLEEAAALYSTLPQPEALINRGICMVGMGRRDEGQALFQKALERLPGNEAAAYNMGQEPPGPRVERLKRLGVSRLLPALPSPDIWSAAWQERAHPSSAGLEGLVQGLSQILSTETQGMLGGTELLLALLLGGLCLVSLARPEVKAEEQGPTSRLGRVLSVLAPGSGTEWGGVGPLLLTALIMLGLIQLSLSRSEGMAATALEHIAVPNFTGLYGATARVTSGPYGLLEQLGHYGWVFWLGGVVLSAGLVWGKGSPSARQG